MSNSLLSIRSGTIMTRFQRLMLHLILLFIRETVPILCKNLCNGILVDGGEELNGTWNCVEVGTGNLQTFENASDECLSKGSHLFQFQSPAELSKILSYASYLKRTAKLDQDTKIWVNLLHGGSEQMGIGDLIWRHPPFLTLKDSLAGAKPDIDASAMVNGTLQCVWMTMDESHSVKLSQTNCSDEANVVCIRQIAQESQYSSRFIVKKGIRHSPAIPWLKSPPGMLHCAKACHHALGCLGFNFHSNLGTCELVSTTSPADQLEDVKWSSGLPSINPVNCTGHLVVVEVKSLDVNDVFTKKWCDQGSACEWGIRIRFGLCSIAENMNIAKPDDVYLVAHGKYWQHLTSNPSHWSNKPTPVGMKTSNDHCAYLEIVEDDPPDNIYEKMDDHFCTLEPIPLAREGEFERSCNSNQTNVPLVNAIRILDYSEIRVKFEVKYGDGVECQM